MPGFSIHACGGCPRATTRASDFKRFRGDRWCPSCEKKVRAGEPTPRDVARATGGDTRSGAHRLLDAMAGVEPALSNTPANRSTTEGAADA